MSQTDLRFCAPIYIPRYFDFFCQRPITERLIPPSPRLLSKEEPMVEKSIFKNNLHSVKKNLLFVPKRHMMLLLYYRILFNIEGNKDTGW